jgi:hypothetical protein
MHREWENYQFLWERQYQGYAEGCTVIHETVASQDIWIYPSVLGMEGSHNNNNVLQRSPVFSRLAEENTPMVNSEINGHPYDKGYYLSHAICPPWSTFVKRCRIRKDDQDSRFAKDREAAWKDMDRALGALQSRCAIVQHLLAWAGTKLFMGIQLNTHFYYMY